jgi:SPP1 gp7 family putative phage head morphogenesis protein
MANKALIEMATRHAIYLESLKAHNLNDYDAFLKEMAKVIKARLGGEDLTAFARDRLERTLELVAADLRTITSQASKTLRDQATDLAAYESGFETKSLSGLTQAEFVLPTAAQLAAAVLYTPLAQIQGAAGSMNLEAAMKRWGDDVIAQVQSAIQGGYYRGETTDQIIRSLLGTVKGRYTDGELARVKRDLESVVRTGLQHAANQARNQVWTNNSDIVKKWRFVATLDLKTSRQCQALDKTTWPLGQGPLPPLHYRCRSTSVAKLDDAFDALEEGAERMARDPETGKSGLVDNKLSYYDWLKRQDLLYVQSVLGKDRAALLLKGGLSAERFAALQLDRQFQPMSLAKIARLDEQFIHAAFRKAGLSRYL